MGMFYTDKSAKAEIAKLNERIGELEADNESAANQIETLTSEKTDLDQKIVELTGEKEASAAKVEELEGKLTEANAKIEAAEKQVADTKAEMTDFDAKVEAAALAKFQSLGGQTPVTGGQSHGDKPDISQLTGLEKAIAAHKAGKSK